MTLLDQSDGVAPHRNVEHLQCGLGSPRVLLQALLLLRGVTSGKFVSLSEPQRPHL